MSSVNVSIFSRSYNIACQPGEEGKLQAAADMFNDELMRIKQSTSSEVDFEKLIVVAGMNMCARHRKTLMEYTDDMQEVMNNNIEFADLLGGLPAVPSLYRPDAEDSEAAASQAADSPQSAKDENKESASGHDYIRTEADEIVISDASTANEGMDFFDDENDTTV